MSVPCTNCHFPLSRRSAQRTADLCGNCVRDLQHTWVEVRPSRIPGAGLGLFARRDFAAGQRVCDFGGIDVTTLHGCSMTHTLQLRQGLWRDGDPLRVPAPGQSDVVHPGWAQYANRARPPAKCKTVANSREVANAELVVRHTARQGQEAYLRCCRAIRADDEILTNYGGAYRLWGGADWLPPAEPDSPVW
jgi:hypothetical protein